MARRILPLGAPRICQEMVCLVEGGHLLQVEQTMTIVNGTTREFAVGAQNNFSLRASHE
jgi:hypothetical protein